MLVAENGPLDVFAKIRAFLAKKQKHKGGLYDLISCFYCTSVWIGGIISIFIAPTILTYIICVFILSGIAVIIQKILDK